MSPNTPPTPAHCDQLWQTIEDKIADILEANAHSTPIPLHPNSAPLAASPTPSRASKKPAVPSSAS